MNNDSLGMRMKEYEKVSKSFLPIRIPIIIRLDGKSFSQYTRGCKQPIDSHLVHCMNETAKYLCENIQGCKLAYVQSDEISLLLVNYENLKSQPWFGNSIQKMCSISAGMASAKFSLDSGFIFGGVQKLATFDCRAFVVPKEEVNNFFIWRQEDTIRNSIQSLARSMFSHKECHNKDQKDLINMCLNEGIDWYSLPNEQKFGRCIEKVYKNKTCIDKKTGKLIEVMRNEWLVNNNIPKFTEDRQYIEKFILKNKDMEI